MIVALCAVLGVSLSFVLLLALCKAAAAGDAQLVERLSLGDDIPGVDEVARAVGVWRDEARDGTYADWSTIRELVAAMDRLS